MGRIFTLISFLGALVLIAIIILAIMSITGQFEPQFTNPPT
jgi:hypothetical protein